MKSIVKVGKENEFRLYNIDYFMWIKKQLVYNAFEHQLDWAENSALTPTPILINQNIIRVYFGARDSNGVSRIRFIDLNADNPAEILAVCKKPVLEIGVPGSFDDNGMILGDIVKVKGQYYMFYVGFQLVEKVKFLAFTGLAMSSDNAETFIKCSNSPVLDRADEGIYIRAIHTAMYENDIWKIWYAAGNSWTYIDGTPFPSYHINYIEASDLFNLPKQGIICIKNKGNEYRIGRPRVYKTSNGYCLYYTKGETDRSYLPGFAVSKNGMKWTRQDHLVGITTSQTGWDSETICYPSLLTVPSGKTYMFYNGNKMGLNGFGWAELNRD